MRELIGSKVKLNPAFVKAYQQLHPSRRSPVPAQTDTELLLYLLADNSTAVLTGVTGTSRVSPYYIRLDICWSANDGTPVMLHQVYVNANFSAEDSIPAPIFVAAEQKETAFTVRPLSKAELKVQNTRRGATTCVGCGTPLRNPMAPAIEYQHCPKCEG